MAAEVTVAREGSLRRAAALTGATFLVVDLVGILLGGPLPAADAPLGEISEFYAGHSGALLAQAYVRGLSMALLVGFGALLARALGVRSAPHLVPVFAGSMFVVAAVELARVAVVAGVAVQSDRLDPSALAALHAVGLLLGAVIAFPVAAAQVAAWRMLPGTGLPSWLGPAGLAVGAAWLVTGVRTVATNQALWVSGTVVTFAWGIWLATVCAFLYRRRDG